MEIDLSKVRNGEINGKYVWICDYRPSKAGIHAKPVRHVKSQKVLIMPNEGLKRTIYYSESHFVALNKKGLPLKSKIIVLFDNTGYRSYTGIALKIFTTEKECIKQYNTFKKVFDTVAKMSLPSDVALFLESLSKSDDRLISKNAKTLIKKYIKL